MQKKVISIGDSIVVEQSDDDEICEICGVICTMLNSDGDEMDSVDLENAGEIIAMVVDLGNEHQEGRYMVVDTRNTGFYKRKRILH